MSYDSGMLDLGEWEIPQAERENINQYQSGESTREVEGLSLKGVLNNEGGVLHTHCQRSFSKFASGPQGCEVISSAEALGYALNDVSESAVKVAEDFDDVLPDLPESEILQAFLVDEEDSEELFLGPPGMNFSEFYHTTVEFFGSIWRTLDVEVELPGEREERADTEATRDT